MVPHLTTSLTGPLHELERVVLDQRPEIERWFRTQWLQHDVPFYASVDLRNSGFKLAPVDTNLFPGGFNNLNPEFLPLCVHAAMGAIQKICPDTSRFLLVPENHTRNLNYLSNVAMLRRILEGAGLTVRIGSLLPDLERPMEVEASTGEKLLLEPIQRRGNRVGLEGFDPCAVLLNNDLSAGIPAILRGIEQPVVPPLEAGWSTRRKSHHFHAYDRVAEGFAQIVGIDPWVINPFFSQCGKVNFSEKEGEECLATNVEFVLNEIREKYAHYGITDEPFVIVKADAGTYGMGIMTVKSPDDVRNLNRKTRNKMATIKEGQPVHEVIIQEGVYTFESVEGAVAEPVIYMVDQFVVGGFYRVHTERGIDENLNSPGAKYVPLAFETNCHTPDCSGKPGDPPNRFYTYGVVARLANLAAAIEIEELVARARAPEVQAANA
ncbi:MAG TPA: glutamate--cysteine ligase [Usitatibacter sp.]|jgi:glutamate--cysteine ligase|nr:glutamate--cysteine ligase [Usitatibacter sp.]